MAVPGRFGRFVFAIPRPDGVVMIGVTDDPYEGPVEEEPPVEPEDEGFLLETLSLGLEHPLTTDESPVASRGCGRCWTAVPGPRRTSRAGTR